jgi:hypothetical protein
MGFFVLNSDITIGNFQFSGVNEVHISRGIHGVIDTATIHIPSISKIVSNGKVNPDIVVTGKQFSDGDPVTIKLGYNGNLQTEFMGFVKRRNLDMPLVVECEGYSWLLRRNNVNIFYPTVSVADLLAAAVAGIDADYIINVQCEVDITLNNVSIENKCGLEVLDMLSTYTDDCLTCFFIEPNTLWCGLVYTPFAGGDNPFGTGEDINSVNYRLGYNLVKDNSLEERLTENDPVLVRYSKKLANGTVITATSDAFPNYVRNTNKILNHITDAASLTMLANEKAYKLNYAGYEGSLRAFLQPYCLPGYNAYIADDRYPERNGNYLVEGVQVDFGVNGARRIIEMGPLSGFANV